MNSMTTAESRYCEAISEKDQALRAHLASNNFPASAGPRDWLQYLAGIKSVLGNINNDLGFVATLLVKQYLMERFGVTDFDAAGKPQGSSGVDIRARTPGGQTIVGEIKTTKPYQPGFGAAQRTSMLKDLARLAASTATHRIMFVIDPDAFAALCKPTFSSRAPGVEIVDLLTRRTFLCAARAQAR